MIYFALLHTAAVGFQSASTPLWLDTYKEYRACLTARSAILEQSNAPFDDIFAAAKQRCVDEWGALYDQLVITFQTASNAQSRESPATKAFDFSTSLEESLKNEIRLIVLGMRAKRNRQ